jgi:sugar lactone lactonase YvrE
MRKKLWLAALALAFTGAGFGQNFNILTLAGGGAPQNIPAASASLGFVTGVAADGAGNVYMSLQSYSVVVRMDTQGLLTLVAGNGTAGYSGDNGPAARAQLNAPWGIAVDSAGNLYIADSGNNRVRKVSNGVITTVAGNNVAAQLSNPTGVAVDTSGNIYIADANNNVIRKVSNGVTTTVAGTGTAGGNLLTGPATSVQLNAPWGVAVDGSGNLYIADYGNNIIRKVSGGALTSLINVTGPTGIAVDAAGNQYVTSFGGSFVGFLPVSGSPAIVAGNQVAGYAGDGGAATSAELDGPASVALDPSGNLYIADYYNNVVRKVSGGAITTVAGGPLGLVGDNGPATSSQLLNPEDAVADASGNIYIADSLNNRIRKVTNGTITTITGTGLAGYSGDGAATSAQLSDPTGLALDAAGNLYVADTGNNLIRKITGGVITTVVGTFSGGSLLDNVAALSAQLSAPTGLALDAAGNIYIADSGTHRIRKVANGVITTVAGNGVQGYNGDGIAATNAALNYPSDVKLDAAGNLYIADHGNNLVRMVAGGSISSIAGNGVAGYGGDNGPATSAQLNGPSGIAVDSAGNVFIADTNNNLIRRVSGGAITTVAGNGTAAYGGDNGPATSAELNGPLSVSLDAAGRIYVADSSNNLIRGVNFPCDFSLKPASIAATAAGGSFQVAVQTESYCSWAVTGLPDWITYAGAPLVSGPAAATLVVAADLGAARNATISIAGMSVSVTQAACAYTLSPGGQVFTASGGTGSVTITTSPRCAWSATNTNSWVTFPGTTAGAGSGSVAYQVSANLAGRSGTISIAGLPFTIEQQSLFVPGSFVGSMPHIAAQENWTTTFTLVNTTTEASQARLSLFGSDTSPGGDGSPLPLLLNFPQPPPGSSLLAASVDRTLLPGASLLVQTSEQPNLPVATGSVQVNANSPMSGFAIFRRVSDAQEAVVPLETRNAPSYLLVFDNTNGLSLGVAVANISTQAANIGVVIRDDTGAQIATGSIPTIKGSGQTSFMLTGLFPATANRRGTIEFDTPSGGQISVLGIRFGPLAKTLTTVPPLANVGTGGGDFAYLASGGDWKTTIVLVNTGAKPALSHLKFFGRDGSPWSLPISFPQSGGSVSPAVSVDQTLAAGATLLIESTGASTTDPLVTGSAQLATDGNVSGFVIFRHLTNGQEAVVPIESRNASAYLLAFDNTGGTITGVALSSVSAQTSPVSVGVVIRDDTGVQILTDTISVPANGLQAFTLAADAYLATTGIRGTIEFDLPKGEQIGVLGIRLPVSRTLTTLPALVK